jgi:hypothetical protein
LGLITFHRIRPATQNFGSMFCSSTDRAKKGAILMKTRLVVTAGVIGLLMSSVVAEAQGVGAGARVGSRRGYHAGYHVLGPVGGFVGGVVGGVTGGVIGGVNGAFGGGYYRHRYYHHYS